MAEPPQGQEPRNMRSAMPWLFPASTDQVLDHVARGLVAVDANVLLGLYRLLPPARRETLSAMEALGDRLFIPHQVADEFLGGRLKAIGNLEQDMQETASALQDIRKRVDTLLSSLQRARHVTSERATFIEDQLATGLESLESLVKELQEQRDVDQVKHSRSDPVLEAVEALTVGRLGPAPSPEELEKARGEAKIRFERRQPPGYADAEKKNNAIGDYLVWAQVLVEAATRGLPVVLVTDDNKEDWIWREGGLKMGARRELVREMHEQAGVAFILLNTVEFLSAAKTALAAPVSEETLAQTRDSARRYRRAQQDLMWVGPAGIPWFVEFKEHLTEDANRLLQRWAALRAREDAFAGELQEVVELRDEDPSVLADEHMNLADALREVRDERVHIEALLDRLRNEWVHGQRRGSIGDLGQSWPGDDPRREPPEEPEDHVGT